MKTFFKPGLMIMGIIVFLAAVFAGILYFQSTAPKTPTNISDTRLSEKTPAPGSVEDSIKIAEKTVNIEFSDESRNFEYNNIPLFKVKLKNEKPIEITADGNLIKSLVEKLPEPENFKEPVPAKVETKKNQFSRIVRGEPGYSIDKEKTLKALEESITRNAESELHKIKIVMSQTTGKENFSEKMKEMGFKHQLASVDAVHSGQIENIERNVNLEIAAKKIDGLIIPPGGKFSFNKIVGPRTEKHGFKKAGVISQGRVIQGLGGGICQVSTALYRATLLSGLKIDERHNHSIYDGIEYAARGLDAAVAWGYKDFRFTNSLKTPVVIVCKSGKGQVNVEIFSQDKPYENIAIETRNEVKHPFKVQKKSNGKLKKGEVKVVHPGIDGYSIEVFRILTEGGKTREERLSKDRYLTYNRIEEINN